MKKKLIALPFGLLASVIGSSAFANASVHFEGTITAETCPIEIVNPGDGSIGNRIAMGDVPLSKFGGATGVEVRGASFAVRVPDKAGCGLTTETKANVTYNGDADPSGDYFRVDPATGAATGVAIAIRDINKTSVAPGGTSADYDLNATGPTDMRFDVYYRSIDDTVTAGPASAQVRYSVAYK